jgi:hypothetical protein
LTGALPIASREQGAALADAMSRASFAEASTLFEALAASRRIPPKMAAAFGDFAAYWDEAEAAERAHALAFAARPTPESLLARALSRLRLGAWRDGWIDMESRLEARRLVPVQALRGRDSGRTVERWRVGQDPPRELVVFTEQGLGDTLQFSRFLPDLIRRGVGVTVIGAAALEPVIASLHPAPRFHVLGEALFTRAERWCGLMSLPALLGFDREADLVRPPYLFQDLVAAEDGRGRTGPVRVGLCWQGNPNHPNDLRRSAPLQALAPLLDDPRIEPVSLQIGQGARQLWDAPAGRRFSTPLADGASLTDTARVIGGLDLIVSVDTAVAHLAGAMGRRTVLLLASEGVDWRWKRGGGKTPWYGAMTVVQQTVGGDWRGPAAEALAIAATLSRRAPSSLTTA